ncbi:uncharacterized protein LOC126901790 isoform X3 [Daktulosphaira vitifoliae]|uniref:uncharacterized protein LOC126901790 isoform X3 n=1 Tax=Daktulosphaira vitifoliae TaxID=58002 RepID=UPI0021AA04B4|nr:uncharacterized protein LOC126901790 isoform X3 [Daktulosphaira vitifoliae]
MITKWDLRRWTYFGVLIIFAEVLLCFSDFQYDDSSVTKSFRKIRHDHKLQQENESVMNFEFETTKGLDYENYSEEDSSDEAFIEVIHDMYDTRKGIVPHIIYQVRINYTTTLYNYTLSVNGKLVARGQPSNDDPITFNWTATAADQSHKYLEFRLVYSTVVTSEINISNKRFLLLKDCELHLLPEKGTLSSKDLPSSPTTHGKCVLKFPQKYQARLIVDLVKLNMPCKHSHLQLSGHKVVCGKLEDLHESDRHYVFNVDELSSVTITGWRFTFTLIYKYAASCFDNEVSQQNGTIVFVAGFECRYKIIQPYGYRIRLLINSIPYGHVDSSVDDVDEAKSLSINTTPLQQYTTSTCSGILFWLTDGPIRWSHCASTDSPKKHMSMLSNANIVLMESSSVSLRVPTLKVTYKAEPINEIVKQCPYGSVSLKSSQCLTIINEMQNWNDAEDFCIENGGHLVSIDSHQTQLLIDTILINSPGYNDNAAYWIGATDINNEGFFQWTDSSPFTFSNWYQGHVHPSQVGSNSKQPNDDGLSQQDCIELRQVYGSQNRLFKYFIRNSSYTWNDRDCTVRNRFLCQIQQHTLTNIYDSDDNSCNSTIKLTNEMRFVTISSPGFPQPYPDNLDCTIKLEVPRDYQIEVEFDELVLENESTCSYDYVELIAGDEDQGPKYCGDKSDVLKLTRYVTERSKLKIHFVSDYSHSFSGFRARVSAEHVNNGCDDARQQMYNGSCYLFASYPEVSWHTAKSICNGIKAELTSVHSAEEEQFIESFIRESSDSRSAIYWLGGTWDEKYWYWIDNSTETFSAWLAINNANTQTSYKDLCLAISWLTSPPVNLPRGLYWTANICNTVGGYICKKKQLKSSDYYNLNKTVSGISGVLTSLNYPANYYHNLDYWTHVVGPDRARIVFQFDSINIEPQVDCLYDYVSVMEKTSQKENDRAMTVCGYRGNNLEDYIFVTESNEAYVHFQSDYSVSSFGFHLKWNVIDMSGCPSQTLTAFQGQVVSPNYPNFILPNLNCITMILAPVGRRIWIEFVDYNLDNSQSVKIYLSRTADYVTPFKHANSINDGAFLSDGESVKIEYKTNSTPRGRGFKIAYKIITDFNEERSILLPNNSIGFMYRLNYPLPMHIPSIRYRQRLKASIGNFIQLQFNHVVPAQMDTTLGRTICPGHDSGTIIEIHDHYASQNGTWWLLCENVDHLKSVPISISSYLNTISIVTIYNKKQASILTSINISISVKNDPEWKNKLITLSKRPETDRTQIETCTPNPCVNGGTCVLSDASQMYFCKCQGNHTGLFCSLNHCDLGHCVFGECQLTGNNGYHCKCQYGYTGKFCNEKIKPCDLNPCKDHGECIALGDLEYQCRCYTYWTGNQCEKKMFYITYKPLTERMLHEPFWLGLLTVFMVLGILGLIWCAKRHVPEKIEKILSEEAERSRHFTVNASGRMSSMRSELLVPTVMTNGATPSDEGNSPTAQQPQAKTFLRRLGIRKPSLMSLTSPLQSGRTARTFSLDDLLRPQVPRFSQHRTKQKSAVSSRLRTSIADKSEILQQLISPGLVRQASFNDEINLVDKLSTNNIDPNDIFLPSSHRSQETSFSNDCSLDEAMQKIEKKVTFARLMNKFQSEMSSTSCSEADAQAKRMLRRPNLNQGSDSMSSLEFALENCRKSNQLLLNEYQQQSGNQKAMSADSILAMFRNLNHTIAVTEMGNYLSASTTPSCSSLQDEIVGCSEDESSISNTVHSPSGGGKESPTRYRYSNIIQIPVIDVLSSQRNCSNNSLNSLQHPPSILLEVPNYRMDCLSPIHEMPTPIPSPSPTPITSRKSSFGYFKDHDNQFPFNNNKLESTMKQQLQPIPTLVVQQPTPINSPSMEFPGSPPPHKEKNLGRKMLKDLDKPISLDLPAPPPVITVTCMSDSDTESVTTTKNGIDSSQHSGIGVGGNGNGMCYLSPFSMCSRADRIASESNLSSSGYSSGPSRCNSNTRLCPLESEEQQPTRRSSPLIHAPPGIREVDSEETTFSENDDEGFHTEPPNSKKLLHRDSRTKSCSSTVISDPSSSSSYRFSLPSITIQQYPSSLHLSTDILEKSPVSSRSESPLSDKTVFRFSSMFYGRNTDSDSIYDFTSSDCTTKKRLGGGKKREKKRRIPVTTCCTPEASLLDVPGRIEKKMYRTKPNTRRRSRSQQTVIPSSSSSTDSLNDTNRMNYYTRQKQSYELIKKNESQDSWTVITKTNQDSVTKRKSKPNESQNKKFQFQNKTVSDCGCYGESDFENEKSIHDFTSLPSLVLLNVNSVICTKNSQKINEVKNQEIKKVTASD